MSNGGPSVQGGDRSSRAESDDPELHGAITSDLPLALGVGCLANVKVLDFTTLLPGPLATLILAEAGANVVKIERPGFGDEMRTYVPRFGSTSANFALLNRGKRSVVADLKDAVSAEQVRGLADHADVLIEQFRPGTMSRLGLGYDDLKARNPRLVYCSITGYGQRGPLAAKAGHDLNYVAEAGLLGLTRGPGGGPSLPAMLNADIAGGAYPAVMNILLALIGRERTGIGSHLDISMTANMFTTQYWGLANGRSAQMWPSPGCELLTGGSPRYHLYETADGGWLAVAALEQRFWDEFCESIGLSEDLRDDTKAPGKTESGVAQIIASKEGSHWQSEFAGRDVCVSLVRSLESAVGDPHFSEWLAQPGSVQSDGQEMSALPVPVAPVLRGVNASRVPALGEDSALLDDPDSRW